MTDRGARWQGAEKRSEETGARNRKCATGRHGGAVGRRWPGARWGLRMRRVLWPAALLPRGHPVPRGPSRKPIWASARGGAGSLGVAISPSAQAWTAPPGPGAGWHTLCNLGRIGGGESGRRLRRERHRSTDWRRDHEVTKHPSTEITPHQGELADRSSGWRQPAAAGLGLGSDRGGCASPPAAGPGGPDTRAEASRCSAGGPAPTEGLGSRALDGDPPRGADLGSRPLQVRPVIGGRSAGGRQTQGIS